MTSLGIFDLLSGGSVHPAVHSLLEAVHPATPSPDKTSCRTVLITGASAGLGKHAALAIAAQGHCVIMACRSVSKAQRVIDDEFENKYPRHRFPDRKTPQIIGLDLSDWSSVDRCAQQLLDKGLPIHVLMNNAGIMAPPSFTRCKQGLEMQLSTNHFGHFLLTLRLLPLIFKAATDSKDARIVILSSHAHKFAVDRSSWSALLSNRHAFCFDLCNTADMYVPFWNYAQTKLANLLFARELARRVREMGHPNIHVNAVHPGGVDTDLYTHSQASPMRTVIQKFLTPSETGAITQTFAAMHADIIKNHVHGQYLAPVAKITLPSSAGQDDQMANKLWEWSEKVLCEKGFKVSLSDLPVS